MSDEYTPTTDDVRLEYMAVRWSKNDTVSFDARAEFDRWLAEVQANAWDEGFKNSVRTNFHDRMPRLADNPYRKEQGNE